MTESDRPTTVQGPDGAWYARVPEDAVLCVVPKETAEKYADWTECAAFRVAREDERVATLEVTDDLEALTAPEAQS